KVKEILQKHNVENPKVALLGLSFKGNVDDMRESPSLKVMEYMNEAGLSYTVFDPHIKDIRVPHQVTNLSDAVTGADLIVILTDHKKFGEYNPEEVGQMMNHNII